MLHSRVRNRSSHFFKSGDYRNKNYLGIRRQILRLKTQPCPHVVLNLFLLPATLFSKLDINNFLHISLTIPLHISLSSISAAWTSVDSILAMVSASLSEAYKECITPTYSDCRPLLLPVQEHPSKWKSFHFSSVYLCCCESKLRKM